MLEIEGVRLKLKHFNISKCKENWNGGKGEGGGGRERKINKEKGLIDG